MNEEQALEVMKRATKQNPAVGSGYQETVKTKAVRSGSQEFNQGEWNSYGAIAVVVISIAVLVYALVVFLPLLAGGGG